MRSTILKIKLFSLFSICSFTFASGQVDSLTQSVTSNLSPLLFEFQFHFERLIQENPQSGVGLKVNYGVQKVFQGNKSVSLFAGINTSSLSELSGDINLRFSHFKHYTETYFESGIKIYTNKNDFNAYSGYSFSIGQFYRKHNLGFFVAYDRYRNIDRIRGDIIKQDNYLRIGLNAQKKSIFYTIIGLIGLVLVT